MNVGEGLLLAPASDRSRSSILPLLRGGFPLVLIDRTLPDAECDLIVSDNTQGAPPIDRASRSPRCDPREWVYGPAEQV